MYGTKSLCESMMAVCRCLNCMKTLLGTDSSRPRASTRISLKSREVNTPIGGVSDGVEREERSIARTSLVGSSNNPIEGHARRAEGPFEKDEIDFERQC